MGRSGRGHGLLPPLAQGRARRSPGACRRLRGHGGGAGSLVRMADRPGRSEGSVMTGPILGLCSFAHDSAAALVAEGKLVGLVEEERLSGIKHAKSFPQKGITWLLSKAGLS